MLPSMPPAVSVIFATTSGNTEYVVSVLVDAWRGEGAAVTLLRAERAQPGDLSGEGALVLACGTWNQNGVEGQMDPCMDAFLRGRAGAADLAGRPAAVVGLGDGRYYYTGRATEHLLRFLREHGGTPCGSPLLVIGTPEGQEEKIRAWAGKFLESIPAVPSASRCSAFP